TAGWTGYLLQPASSTAGRCGPRNRSRASRTVAGARGGRVGRGDQSQLPACSGSGVRRVEQVTRNLLRAVDLRGAKGQHLSGEVIGVQRLGDVIGRLRQRQIVVADLGAHAMACSEEVVSRELDV